MATVSTALPALTGDSSAISVRSVVRVRRLMTTGTIIAGRLGTAGAYQPSRSFQRRASVPEEGRMAEAHPGSKAVDSVGWVASFQA